MSMKSTAFRGLVLAALLSSVSGWAEATRYIVTFKNSDRYQAASVNWQKSQKLAEMGLAPATGEMKLLNTSATVLAALDNVEMMIIETSNPLVVEQLRRNPSVADVEAEVFFPAPKAVKANPRLKPSEGCNLETPWGIKAVKADKAWAVTKGSGARIMVLDTGVDKSHPALQSRVLGTRDFTSTGETDTIGHGTHVAGTIAADGTCLVGVAPEAKVYMGKVCSANGCGSAAIIAGIDWGVSEKASAISMSLGGPLATPSQQRAVERAEAAGVVVVAASGNDGVRRISYPAAYPNVIAVGAVGLNNGEMKRAEFSQYGPGLDIVAPGVDVVSSVPQGAGRVSNVTVDVGDGKSARVKSASFGGAPQIEDPVSGQLVFAGLGKPDEISKVNLRGKFALIMRGEIAFKDKVVNAFKAGATGVIIYNNAEGLARGTVGEEGSVTIPVAMIEKTVGEQIKANLASGRSATASVVTEASDYDSYDGTSMATPHVAGVIALIRSANPRLTPAQVRDVLSRTANQLGAVDEYGAGVVNAEAAVGQARRAVKADLATDASL
ncbi:MAG: S8 family serine peptidase [Bdellovibrionales bacterium]